MKKAVLAIITATALAGCATATPGPTPTVTPPQATGHPTASASPTSTPVPSPTPTLAPAHEGCIRATTEILEGQNPYWYTMVGPAKGCYEDPHDFLTDVGLSGLEFEPGIVISLWTRRDG